ncbi:MAG TPA: anthranilate synthase family protein [Aeromicrobium sp.]|nr:anthranilate synthase family protein [Aeromicrobium sp.]
MTQHVLAELLTQPAFALIRGREADTVTLLAGPRTDIEKLADIPLSEGPGPAWDNLVLVPFSQVAERGFQAHQDGTPLSVIEARTCVDVPLVDLLEVLPDLEIEMVDRGGFETSDADYAKVVRQIIDEEIGQGEGANLVVGRRYTAKVADWGHERALSVFRRLLERERGSFWTFCIFTGDRYLIGASPERHVSLDAGQLRMNPISGTFRMRGLDTNADRKRELLKFLADEKEIYELFMVVDEELKMMCDLCHEGGLVLGPYLKPMTHLVHTEYLLAGRTDLDPRVILRDSMFAATVTGSPVENACRLIKQYEAHGRGYYASVAALVGRDEAGQTKLDAPILIRTADVDLAGNLSVTAGATLVRDSDADYETNETWAKASGILSAFGLVEAAALPVDGYDAFTRDDEVLIALGSRNQRLSQFWLSDQSQTPKVPNLIGKRVVVLDGEDDFVNMLGHVFAVMGMTTEVIRHDAWTTESLDGHDLVVIGPGPGDPRDDNDPKIKVLRAATQRLLDRGQPFLAICLGHQTLSHLIGLDLVFKDIVFQGTQSALPILGRTETVGFYNTFVARVPESGLPAGVSVETDPASGDIHLVAGPAYRGIQFHAESILTQHGYSLLRELTESLLS